jgi:hypothetical protein
MEERSRGLEAIVIGKTDVRSDFSLHLSISPSHAIKGYKLNRWRRRSDDGYYSMLHEYGYGYRIWYGAGTAIRKILKTSDKDVAIYNKLLYKNIKNIYNK